MRAIDRNVLVRLITRDNSRQAASAESLIEKGAWVSVLALTEATWVLGSVYELSSSDQARAVEMLLNHRDLVLQDPETVAAALHLFRAKPSLGFFRLPDASTGAQSRTPSRWHVRQGPGQDCRHSEAIARISVF